MQREINHAPGKAKAPTWSERLQPAGFRLLADCYEYVGSYFRRQLEGPFNPRHPDGDVVPHAFQGNGRTRTDAALVDRILKKVYESGIHSLTEAEKQALREATERQKAMES